MFEWYFEDYFIENGPLFWIGFSVIILIIIVTIVLVCKELKIKNDVNK